MTMAQMKVFTFILSDPGPIFMKSSSVNIDLLLTFLNFRR